LMIIKGYEERNAWKYHMKHSGGDYRIT